MVDTKQSLINIVNGHVITPDGIIRNGSVLVGDGIIIGVSDHDSEMPGAVILNAGGKYISPVPPARLFVLPATASQALPTYG